MQQSVLCWYAVVPVATSAVKCSQCSLWSFTLCEDSTWHRQRNLRM